jgi:phosphonate transport system permease protein
MSSMYLEYARRRMRTYSITSGLTVCIALATLWIAVQLGFDLSTLQRAGTRLMHLLPSMVPPVLDSPPDILSAAMESVQVAVIGTLLGIAMAAVLGVLAARNISPHPIISWSIKLFAAFVRAVPALIWALIFVTAVGLGPVPGILALAVNSLGMLVKAFAETIEEIDMGPVEALRAAGAGRYQIIAQSVLPAVNSAFIAWSVFRFDIHVRYASVLGIVGAGGIGWELMRAMRMSRFDWAFGITLVIFAMVLITEFFSSSLKRYFLGGRL